MNRNQQISIYFSRLISVGLVTRLRSGRRKE